MKLVWLIRHGACEGNLNKRYIGRTDEPLCPQGREGLLLGKRAGNYAPVESVYTSPMKRCIQTAGLLYPERTSLAVQALRECDFGLFEGRNYKELACEPLYQTWIDSRGLLPFPGGESAEEFKERSVRAVLGILEGQARDRTALVVHGGTIMAVMEALCTEKREYYGWQVPNGGGYLCVYTPGRRCLRLVREIGGRQERS